MMGSGEIGTESMDGSEARKPDPAATLGSLRERLGMQLESDRALFEGTIKPTSCSSSIVGHQTATELLADRSLLPPYWLSRG